MFLWSGKCCRMCLQVLTLKGSLIQILFIQMSFAGKLGETSLIQFANKSELRIVLSGFGNLRN